MIRKTSIEVYHRIKSEGLLSKKRMEIYDILYLYGDQTSAEVNEKLIRGKQINGLSQSRARFTELREMGAIEELGTKTCSVTGNTAILWSTTNTIPNKIKKETRKTKKAKVLDLLKNLAKISDEDKLVYLREIYKLVDSM